jgi:hypothetical protein
MLAAAVRGGLSLNEVPFNPDPILTRVKDN